MIDIAEKLGQDASTQQYLKDRGGPSSLPLVLLMQVHCLIASCRHYGINYGMMSVMTALGCLLIFQSPFWLFALRTEWLFFFQ